MAEHPELAGYPVVIALDVAWADMDVFAHVNNVVYFRYFEMARVAYLDQLGWFALMRSEGFGPIVAATQARFRKPVSYPDRLLVGARITQIDIDRVTFEHRVISTKWDTTACDGTAVVVSYNYRGASKAELPASIRAEIAAIQGTK